MDNNLKKILTELRRQLEGLYGERLVRMVLNGSHALGDAEAGSDIDLLVVLKGNANPGEEIKRTSAIVASLSLENDMVLSRAFVSEDRYEQESGPFIRNVRREGVSI